MIICILKFPIGIHICNGFSMSLIFGILILFCLNIYYDTYSRPGNIFFVIIN